MFRRHVRSIVSLALDALAARDSRHVKVNGYNHRVIRAMRLRYGLDDDRPRTLKEVSQTPLSTWCSRSSGLDTSTVHSEQSGTPE